MTIYCEYCGRENPNDQHICGTAKPLSEPSQLEQNTGEDEPSMDELKDLIAHCWVHSGYEKCGYRKMTTRQKAIFDSLTINLPF